MTFPTPLAGAWVEPGMPWVLLAGRLLLGGLFVVGGIRHLFILDAGVGPLAKRRVPSPHVTLLLASLFQIVAGLALACGWWVRPAAFALAAFTIIASAVVFDFWNYEGEAKIAAINAWQANLGLVGGLLIAAATAAG